MPDYKKNSMKSQKGQTAPQRRRLQAKIMVAWGEVSLLTDLSRGVNLRTGAQEI